MIEQLSATEGNILVGSSNLVHTKQLIAVMPLQLTVDVRDIIIYVEGRENNVTILLPAFSKNEERWSFYATSLWSARFNVVASRLQDPVDVG